MSNGTMEFAMDNHIVEEGYDIGCIRTNYATIPDMNQGNYDAGLITWSNVNLQSTEDGSPFNLPEAKYHIAVRWTLELSGGGVAFTDVSGNTVHNNMFAATKKGNIHFFHNVWAKMGSVPANKSGNGFLNLYLAQKKKERSNLENLEDEMEEMFFDNPYSYGFSNAVGEYNNASEPSLIKAYNEAIYKRNRQFIDISTNSVDPIKDFVNPANLQRMSQPHFTAEEKKLEWNDVLVGNLGDLCDVFANLPPCFKLNGFECKTQLNAGQPVRFIITYDKDPNPTTGLWTPKRVEAQTGNGGTCPILISSASSNLAKSPSALAIRGNGTTDVILTLTVNIGWTGYKQANSILIPYHKLNTPELNKIAANPVTRFACKAFEFETGITGFRGNSSVDRVLPSYYNRPRAAYILPYLSNTMTGAMGAFLLPAYQSPLSSAPNTVTICKLTDFSPKIGGLALFGQEPLYSPVMHYDENYYHLNTKEFSKDNALNNPLKSGKITKAMYNRCYNVYKIDLKHSLTGIEDYTGKQLSLRFFIDAPTELIYDFPVIVEVEEFWEFDSVNGTLAKVEAI